jgi:hypothetical protein
LHDPTLFAVSYKQTLLSPAVAPETPDRSELQEAVEIMFMVAFCSKSGRVLVAAETNSLADVLTIFIHAYHT